MTGKVLPWYKYNGIPSVLQTIMESKIIILIIHDDDDDTEMHRTINHWLFNTFMSEHVTQWCACAFQSIL